MTYFVEWNDDSQMQYVINIESDETIMMIHNGSDFIIEMDGDPKLVGKLILNEDRYTLRVKNGTIDVGSFSSKIPPEFDQSLYAKAEHFCIVTLSRLSNHMVLEAMENFV